MSANEYVPSLETLLEHYEELSLTVSRDPEIAKDNRRIAEKALARARRDAAREALDGFKAWRGTRQCPAISPPDPCNRPEGHDEPHAYDIPEGECDWREVDWSDTDIYRDTFHPEETHE